jgi:mannose-6-phosphate isomerase-like protein (cupin superfamily)
MLIQKISEIKKIKVTNNPKLFKQNLLDLTNLKNCVMFSFGEIKPGAKTTEFVHSDLIKFYLIIKGKMKIFLNSEPFTINQNHIVIINKNEKYQLTNPYKKTCKHIYLGFTIK